jgi:acetoacetate decarboxylase
MLKMQPNSIMLLFVFISFFSCFAQDFDGTNLSSSKPFYGEPPYQFDGSETFFISFKTDPGVIRSLVPEPLVPVSNGIMYISFAKHKIVSPAKLDYLEVYLSIPVAFGKTYGGYIPVLYLNKVEGIIPGREIWGYNKVGADIQFIEEDNKTTITVIQLDTMIIKASFVLAEPSPLPEQSNAANIINLKYVPSVAKDSPADVKQLTISKMENSKTTQIISGKAELEFYSSRYNPLDKIPILEIVKAWYSINSFTLSHGEILHDYLKNEGE